MLISADSAVNRLTTTGADVDFLVNVAKRSLPELENLCSYSYQAFTSLLRGAARSKPWNGGLGSAGAVMTSLYWNGSAFVPINKAAAKKEAVVQRLETAFMAPDATHSLKYRGIVYLRQNGFAATY